MDARLTPMGGAIFAILAVLIGVIAALVAVSKHQSRSAATVQVPELSDGHAKSAESLKRQIANFEVAGLQ